ncbi:MAG: VWA domain-containing protein [Candidatus Thiodiazotropha sp.]
MFKRIFAARFLLVVALCAIAPLSQALEEQADVRILIDVSGSMKQNDPKNLRRPALRLLVGLLPSDTRAGVWTFGRYVNMQIPLGQVDAAWKAKARKSSESIGSPGQFTNIEDALNRATEDWEGPADGYRRSVILLTDGMVDISRDKRKSQASRDRILDAILPRLNSLGATVHTIALSKNADHELMRQLAEDTGGWSEQVENADQLQKVFLRIFEKVGKPDAVPLKDNKFTIDDSITEATVLVFHKADSQPTELVPPTGEAFGAANKPSNVEWHRDQGYDMLTISNPVAGEWKVRAEVDPENRVIVVTDLKMRTTDLPNRLMLGQTLPFEVSFTDHGKLITKEAFLKVVQVAATQKDTAGEQEPKPLQDNGRDEDSEAGDGRFSMQFGGDSLNRGRGELVINAQGRTFVREKRLTFEVVPPVNLQLKPDDTGQKLQLEASADAELITPASLQASVWLEDAAGEREAVTLDGGSGAYRGVIDLMAFSGPRQVVIEASADTLAGEAITFFDIPAEVEGMGAPPPPPPPPAPEPVATPEPVVESAPPPPAEPAPEPTPEPEEEDGWIGAAVLFGVINLLLVGGAAGLFWWLRRRSQRQMVQLVDEDEDAVMPEATGDAAEVEEKPA